MFRIDSDRSIEQGRRARRAHNQRPDAADADNLAIFQSDAVDGGNRGGVFPQPLGRLGKVAGAEGAVEEVFDRIGMQGGRFEVGLIRQDEPQVHGWEAVEFRVAGHAGATPRPVGKVASGGELSRIALALSVVTSQLGQAPTLIFDEVDSGVGGAVAHTVGRLLQQLGRDRQVLAVTHLPQVAACAHHHLQVSKQRQGQQTFSTVQPIDHESRVRELARMLGGGESSDISLAHARELLGA